MTSKFEIGDLVWAKLKGFSVWPARIVEQTYSTPKAPKAKKGKGSQWVYFFGSRNYAWIPDDNIKPYMDFRERFKTMSNTSAFQKAIEEIEEFISQKNENPNYELELPPEQVETPKEKSKERDRESTDEKINKSITPKKPSTPKRQNSDTSGPSSSKRRRSSSPSAEENGIISTNIGTEILNMPSFVERPESPLIEIDDFSELLKTKNISPSKRTFGFIGVGNIGSGIVKNLINSGHRVNLHSRTMKKCDEIKEKVDAIKPGLVNTYITPYDIMQNSDIIFSCVTDPRQAKEIVHGRWGVVGREGDSLEGKGYVEMTGIDSQTSKDICELIKSKGGRYLEAQVQGSKLEADEGSLLVLTAGDRLLFLDCQSCFKAMGKTAFFLGDVGYATKTNLIFQMMKGISLLGLAEGLSLADRCGISSKDILNIFKLTNLSCDFLNAKAEMIVKKDFKHVQQAIEHMQKDMKLALDLSDQLKQPLLMTSTANEVYKHGRRLGYDGRDTACIYMRTRH